MEDFGIVNVINVSVETKRPPLLSYRLFRTHTSYPEETEGRADGRRG